MRLNDWGCIVAAEWVKSAYIRWDIECDEWVVMQNHVHGIARIVADGLDGVAIAIAVNGSDAATPIDVMDGADNVKTVDVMDGSDNGDRVRPFTKTGNHGHPT